MGEIESSAIAVAGAVHRMIENNVPTTDEGIASMVFGSETPVVFGVRNVPIGMLVESYGSFDEMYELEGFLMELRDRNIPFIPDSVTFVIKEGSVLINTDSYEVFRVRKTWCRND